MKKTLTYLFIITLVACSKDDLSNGPTPDQIIYNVNKPKMLQLINDVRAKGCTCATTKMPAVGSVSWSDTLAKTAYLHSVDMKNNNYFSHTSLDGKTPPDRLTAQGYKYATYGENIALGYSSDSAVMVAWLNSEGHCKNLMNGSFKFVGVGMQGNYWTQLFATPK